MSNAIGGGETTEASDGRDAAGGNDGDDRDDGSDTADRSAGEARATAVGFLRHGADVLFVRRPEPGDDRPGRVVRPDAADDRGAGAWDAIRVVAGDDPGAAIRQAIEAAVGTAGTVELVRRGEPFRVADGDAGPPVHPALFEFGGDPDGVDVDAAGRAATAREWVQPTAALDRETVPGLWAAWRRVAPTVGTVRSDAEHGASHLSARALEVLRDRAAALAAGADADGRAEGGDDLLALARTLIDARPGMAVVATRIDRVVTEAGGEPAAVRERAEEALVAAVAAEEGAARTAADRLGALADAPTVLTLSRSGTVRRTLDAVDPGAVLVAESRPGGEGVGVAESLADDAGGDADVAVTLFADAAVARVLGTRAVDAVLVGADSVLPDGTVVNKVGTRTAACAAAHEGVPVYAVCSRDKVRPAVPTGGPELVPRDPAELYDGDRRVAVENPTFDATSPGLVTGILTEDGVLDPGGVEDVAADLRALRDWRRAPE